MTGPQPGLRSPQRIAASLRRYQVIAYVVGVGLIILVCAGVPLKYLAGVTIVVAVVGPLHGFLFIGYVLLTLDLAFRDRWDPVRALLTAAAGTVPFLSFVAERQTTAYVHRQAPLSADHDERNVIQPG